MKNQPIHDNISSTKTNKNMEEDRETLIDPTLYEIYLDVLDLNTKEADNLEKQGCLEITDVETMSDETLRQMLISRDIRASRCERLKAFRTWLREQEAKYTKKEINEHMISDLKTSTLTDILLKEPMHEEELRRDMRIKLSAVEPMPFDGSDEGFERFKQALSAYLGQAELTYIIRHKKSARKAITGMENMDDTSTIESRTTYTLPDEAYYPDTTTDKFKRDNTLVYNMLRAKCTGGPAAECVREHEDSQDGRTTWIKICAWYEGDSVTSTMAMQARSDLMQLRYSDRSRFNNMSLYISKFKKNMTILKNAGQSMTEDAYKQQFLTGITSSDMQAARKTALAHASTWTLDAIMNFIRMSYLQDMAVRNTGVIRERRFAFAMRG
jgi:hypothetical protein